MKRAMVLVSGLAVAVAFGHPWACFHGDPQHSGRSENAVGAPLTRVAAYRLGGEVSGSPVVRSDGNVLVGARDVKLYCLGPDLDTLFWVADLTPYGSSIYYSSPAFDDAGNAMRRAAKEGGVDVLICDPPKLAMGSAGTGSRRHLPKALKAYRRLAIESCEALAPGGLLAFCSCSASMDADSLQRVLALGARQAGKRVVILERTFQGPDHPVPAAFPEGLYLSCLVGRVAEP